MFSSGIIAAAAPKEKDMNVNVEIVEGSGLSTKASTGKCDPYVTFTFRGAKKSTKVISQTLAPVWKEQFTLGSFVAEDLIEVLCWDKDLPADPLGGFTIRLGDFMKPGEHTKSLALEPRGKLEAKGKITIKLYVNEAVTSTIVRKDSTLRRATVSSGAVEQEPENTDKAFVRRKLTGWLKLRPDKDKMEDKLRQMGVISGEASTKMFGASLDEVMSRQKESHPEIPVPIFLHQLIDKLLNDPSTFDEAGLFRISGSAAVTSKIKASVDAGQVPDLSPISRDDAASLLKEYIRQLPEPLFTWKLSDQWKAAADIEDETQLIATLRNLLRKLPGHNRHLWHAVNSFLYKLSQKSDVNKMTAENIGIVIGPNVLWERETRLPIMGMNYIVAHLVNHYTPIFHDWDTWLESQTSDPKLKTSVSQIGSAPVVLLSPRKLGKSLQDWTINDVTNWLNEKGYGQYSEAFTKQNLDGKALHKLTADDLLSSCGIQSLGHRKKIIFRRDELLKSN